MSSEHPGINVQATGPHITRMQPYNLRLTRTHCSSTGLSCGLPDPGTTDLTRTQEQSVHDDPAGPDHPAIQRFE